MLGVASLPESSGQLELEFLGEASYLIFLAEGRSTGREGPFVVGPGEVSLSRKTVMRSGHEPAPHSMSLACPHSSRASLPSSKAA